MHYLNYIGDFRSGFGYGVHTANFYEALKKHYPLIKYEYEGQMSQADFYDMVRQRSASVPGKSINMHIGSPVDYQYMQDHLGGITIGFTPVDYDYIYPIAREVYETIDRIWVPTSWGKKILINNGLSEKKIDVVPEGFDPEVFFSTERKLDKPYFEFITVGKLEDRKGLDILVKAFEKAFENEKAVRLHLLIANKFDPNIDYEAFLAACGVKHREKYILYPDIVSTQTIADLYRSCDADVFTTRSEGWGLPIVDAMASGLPTIVTNYSAQTDYIHQKNAYLLDYKEVRNQSKQFLTFSGLPHALEYFGNWAEPDSDHLIALFRKIFKYREKARKIGDASAQDMLKNWTWDCAAKKAKLILDNISSA